jgi:predicted dehydrogenase
MRSSYPIGAAVALAGIVLMGSPAAPQAKRSAAGSGNDVKFMTVDPGHFHAGLVQKEMVAGVSPHVHVYAPLGTDLLEHLNRIRLFNSRAERPTSWELEVHAGPDFFERMLRERPGNVVMLSGRNQGKIDRIKASIEAGLNVFSDKPWIIEPGDLPKLEAALDLADRKGLIAYDIMTERYEITSILQRELVTDPDTFGSLLPGTEQEPGIYMESVHFLYKLVAGVPNRRPAWFFDVKQQGEALPDVGTHLVDLVQWMIAPGQAIDYRKDVRVLSARRFPTVLTPADFQKVTGETTFPSYLAPNVNGGKLDYYCNTAVSYTLRGNHVKLDVLWSYEPPQGGGDTHFAVFRGSRARVEVRQKGEPKGQVELYVVPNGGNDVAGAVKRKVAALQTSYPGIGVEDRGKELHITIPDKYRVGHEAHFAQVTEKFLGYLKAPKTLPSWEKPNMAAKYYTTTRGLELSRQSSTSSAR